MRRTLYLVLVFAAATSFALPPENPDRAERARHFVLEPQHPLQADEVASLAEKGLIIQRPLGGNRFLVRVREGADLAGDLRIRSLEAFDWTRKIAPSAYAEVRDGRAFSTLRVRFQDDVDLDAAREAVLAAGGMLRTPLAVNWDLPRTLIVRLPAAELSTLGKDERVFGIYGPPLRIQSTNVTAAAVSKVTPLFSAPYNLSGEGVVLSLFELATAETSHIQFQGRMTAHFNVTGSDSLHATHVAGTMISAGIEDARDSRAPNSKGMAPKATLHEFQVSSDFDRLVSDKDTALKPLGSVADNNSWDFVLGWSTEGGLPVWNGDFFGAYDGVYSTPYDAVTVKSGEPLFVHSAGNDAGVSDPAFTGMSPHYHCCDENGNTIRTETFCYSPSGSGNDCTAPCTAGTSKITDEPHCETTKHHLAGPYRTVGIEASLKNVVAVGAMDASGNIADFSSRGPTMDGRIKPEVVAKGVAQFSTTPNGSYAFRNGTSMSSPVVAGIAGLLAEQWRKTFNGQTPSGTILKTLLIAGADDQVGPSSFGDLPGPDYTYGFGLVDAKASVDLILADGGTGSRIRTGSLGNGSVEFPLAVATTQNVRVTLGWLDPEILPPANDPAVPTLLNDLDLKVIDPNGATVLPYVLDKNNPTAPATRGVNTVDTTEMVEIKNAAPGQYRVIVSAKLGDPANHPSQDFALVSSAPLTNAAPVCRDNFEPNDTQSSAYKYLASGQVISARTCSTTDIDFYEINVMKSGPLSVQVTAGDTPLRVTLSGGSLTAPLVDNIPAGASRGVSGTVSPGIYDVKIEPQGSLGTSNEYLVVATFSQPTPSRHRAARH